jgi:urea transport system substrate-binding protein
MSHSPDPIGQKPDLSHTDPNLFEQTRIEAHARRDTAQHGDVPTLSGKAISHVGKTLGKYQITGLIGQGGMGIVLKGHDPLIDRVVAIKLLPLESNSDGISLRRFLAEARAAGKLNHPNVVQIYEVGQQETDYYLVMEYVAAGSVNEHLQKKGAFPVYDATRIIMDACRGLGAAHAAGLVHRDVKPANLLQTELGTVKVTDFGIVKEAHGESGGMTMTGVVIGTPYFMSPEQCEGRPVDARTDLYSLGATYYSLLTGSSPYADSSSMMQVMFAHCHRDPPDPRQKNPALPEACSRIIAKAMAKSPDDRYQNADQMLADLEWLMTTLTQTGTQLPPIASASNSAIHPALSAPKPQTASRRTFLITAGLGGAAVVGGAGAAAWWFSSRNSNSPNPAAAIAPPPVSGPPLKVGVLHSLSGTMSISGSSAMDATLFAIEEINQTGGINGRPVKPVVVDGRSQGDRFAREAERLIKEEQVCTIFGGWTSSSRKIMKKVVEQYDHLLLYPVQYEGLETSPNIVYFGSAPNQQILPAVDWARKTLGKSRFFLVGSDYVFPRAAHAIIRDELAQVGGEVVGEAFVPLGATELQGLVDKIRDASPDMILNCINGDTNSVFFHDLREAGITPADIPTLSFSVGEQELRGTNLDSMEGDYAAWTYFQSLNTERNRIFREAFLGKFPQRVLTDPMASAYTSVMMWAQAAREAQADTPKAIRRGLLNQRFEAPEGLVRIDPDNQHCYKTPRIGRIVDDGQFEVVWEAPEPVAPQPFPPTRTTEEWKAFLLDLQSGWNGEWEAPTK